MAFADIAALLTALYFLGFGAGFVLRPELVQQFGLRWTNGAGRTEVRAYYGALSLALGTFIVAEVVRDRTADALTLALLLAGAVLVARVLGTVIDEARHDSYTRLAIPTEIAFVVLLAIARATA